jgi:hypothetical protein
LAPAQHDSYDKQAATFFGSSKPALIHILLNAIDTFMSLYTIQINVHLMKGGVIFCIFHQGSQLRIPSPMPVLVVRNDLRISRRQIALLHSL